MADRTIDSVQIEIEASAKKAESSVNKLIDNLKTLQEGIGNINMSKLSSLSDSISGLSKEMKDLPKASAFTSLAKGIEKINNVNTSGIHDVCQSLNELTDSVAKLNSSGINDVRIHVSQDGLSASNITKGTKEQLKEGMESFAEFQEKLKTAFSNIQVPDSIEELQKQIAQAEARFDSLLEKENKLAAVNGIDENSSQYRNLQYDIAKVCATLDALYAAMDRAGTQNGLATILDSVNTAMRETTDVANEDVQAEDKLSNSTISLADRLRNLLSSANGVGEKLKEIGKSARESVGNGISKLHTAMEKLHGTVKKVSASVNAFSRGLKGLIGKVKDFVTNSKLATALTDKMKNGFNGLSKALDPLMSKLAKVNRLLVFMLLRKGITAMLTNLGTAFQHLALKSDDFNRSVSELISACSYFAHQVAAMTRPLLDLFGPALVYIINLLGKAISYINQFLSALTGKKTFTNAKKVATDYAGSLKDVAKAAKEVKDATIGIDELNIISPPDEDQGSGAGGSGDLEDCYEELEIDKRILDLVEKIKDIMRQLFAPLKEAWDREGQFVMDAWKYALEEIWKLIKAIGRDFLTVWNQEETIQMFADILHIIGDIGLVVGNLAKNFREAWEENQTGLHILENIRDCLAVVVHNLRLAADYTVEWSKDLDFGPLLTQIQNWTASLVPVFDNLSGVVTDFYTMVLLPLGKWTLEKGLPDLIQVFIDFNERVDWKALRENLAEFWKHLEPFAETVGEGLIIFIDRCATALANFINSDEFVGFLHAIEDWMDSVEPEDVADAIQKLVTALIALKVAVVALDGVLAACKIVETFGKIAETFGKLGGAIKGVIGFFGKIGELIGLLKGGASLHAGMLEVFGTVGTVAAGIASVIGGLVIAVKNFFDMWKNGWDVLKTILEAIGIAIATVGVIILAPIEGIGVAIAAIVAAVVFAVSQIAIVIHDNWDAIVEFFQNLPDWWENTVVPFFQGIPDWFKGVWEKVKNFCIEKWNALLDYLGGIPEKIGQFIEKVGNWFSELPGKIGYALGYALGKVVAWLADMWEKISTKVPEIISKVKEWFSELPGKIHDAIKGAITKVAAWGEEMSAKFHAKVTEIVSKVKEWFQELPGKIYDAISGTISKITTWCSDMKAKLEEKIPEIIDKVVEFFKGIPDRLKELGTDIVNGLINGIKDAWESLKSGVSDFCDGFLQGFKDALGIHSPSKEFAEVGGYSADGLIEGIEGKFSDVQTTVGEWATNVKEWFYGTGTTLKDTFSEYGSNIIGGFKDKVTNTYSTVKDSVTTWATGVKDWFSSSSFGGVNTNTFTIYAGNVVDGFKTKIGNYYTSTRDNITTWANKVKTWFTDDGGVNANKFTSFATNIVDGFKNKVGSYYSVCQSNITSWAGKCLSWFEEKSGKSAWETVATNVVDGFKNKIGALYGTCKDTIQSWGSSIISWFKEKLDINSPSKVFAELGQYTVEGYANGVSKNGDSSVKNSITTFADNILKWFTQDGKINDTEFGLYADNIINGFKNKVTSSYTNVKDSIMLWAGDVRKWYSDSGYGSVNSTTFDGYARNIVDGFKNKVSSYYTSSKSVLTTWASNTKDWFSSSSYGGVNKSTWETYGGNIIDGFKNKVSSSYTSAKSSITTFASSVKSWFEYPDGTSKPSIVSKFSEIGKNVIQGFIDGVNSLWDAAMSKIKAFGQSIIAKGKEGTQEHSPSRAFRQIGAYVVEGFNLGIDSEAGSSLKHISNWMATLGDIKANVGLNFDTSSGMSKLNDYKANLSSGISSDTIIRTVQETVNTRGVVQASLEGNGGLSEALSEAIDNAIGSRLDSIDVSTKRQADKKETTNVYVGNREVAKSVEYQRSANGFSFAPQGA